jgi:predicted N-formylglutamate amidohydrolase
MMALAGIEEILRREGRCVHFSFHSFAPKVAGVARNADIGLLYDPARPRERALARLLALPLRQEGYRVRFNYPYKGISDGHTTSLRHRFAASEYVGLEIEINQNLAASSRQLRRIGKTLAALAGS